jgi:hypothetical protein
MQDQMATFRVHRSALSSGLSRWQWLRNHVIMFDYMLKYNKRDNLLRELSCKYCLSLYVYKLSGLQKEENDFKPLKEFFKRDPDFLLGLFTIIKVPLYILKYRILFRAKSVSENV